MTIALLAAATLCAARADDSTVAAAQLKAVATIDTRFQSYNIEMVEVTGGRFWKPYPRTARGFDQLDRYSARPPIDLANARLRLLAAALSPAYLRVSGTWANATFFADAPGKPPPGFNSVLSRAQWRGVVEFARAVDAEIVTSFAISPGSRDTDGVWEPDQAQQVVDTTRALGGRIAAAEFMNEPTLAATNGAPAGYDAAAYGRDFKIFRDWMRRAAPETLILGPGSAGDAPCHPARPSQRATCSPHPDPASIASPIITTTRSRHAAAGTMIRRRRSRRNGWRARMRHSRPTKPCAMPSSRASRSG
ncbi:hypothetical protein [Bradyrhizobium genosp. SA-3]|uniref:hypothetical protein n=1 Tax=Bradyrhizobium genosp. SA-3 TaxID=508868 RepID=UPI001FDFA837|nr:hypothetical protein [Bradyrhizobium genosp. SA-3]